MVTSKRIVKWLGKGKCDICSQPITDTLYDAKTVYGQWATLCASCFDSYGLGRLGTSYGQCYKKIDKTFIKVEG